MRPARPSKGTVGPWGTASATMESGELVVSLSGEHDLSTAPALFASLASAAAEVTDVVVDLSAVEFMDASTISVIVRTKSSVVSKHGSLTVRAPSSFASRVLDLCQLSFLVDPATVETPHPPGALASWVGVPARGSAPADRVDVRRLTEPPLDAPEREEHSTTAPGDATSSGADRLAVLRELSPGGR